MADPTAAALAQGDYLSSLNVLMQDTNGDSVFSNTRALYGYVEAHEFLVVHHNFDLRATNTVTIGGTPYDIPKVTLKMFGGLKNVRALLGAGGVAYRNQTRYLYYNNNLDYAKIALMNFKKLVEGGVKDSSAFICASLRARWCMLGCYNVSKADTNRPYTEVAIYGDPRTAGNNFAVGSESYATNYDEMAVAANLADLLGVDIAISRRYMSFIQSTDIGAKWVTNIAETIWGAEEFIVRVRGHHFKEAYEENLKKYVEACFEGNETIPKDVELVVLFRTSIHAFGLRALPIVAGHFAIHGKLGNAALIRFSGAPNGMAVVTTTAAAIRAMASEPWYGRFKETYKTQVTLLEEFEKHVLSNKFGFHQSAGLYGVDMVTSVTVGDQTYTIEQMKSVGSVMASIGQGFIEAMKEALKTGAITTFSFSKAKAMEKHAGSAPLTTLRIKTLILYAIDSVSGAKDVSKAIEAAIPESKKVAQVESNVEDVA